MALIVFLRGVNVGGHRTFRPSILAKELGAFDVVNVGAAGTFVVRKPGLRAKFRAALLRKLPFEAEVMLCDGRDLIRLETQNPFGAEASRPDVVRFVSILSKAGGLRSPLPIALPPDGEWLVRLIGSQNRFVFGMYRRHMKTIGYLGQIDKLFGVPATTRNWNTILAIVRILKGEGATARRKANQAQGAGGVQVFELAMDNSEDQDELNRRLRKPGERAPQVRRTANGPSTAESTGKKKGKGKGTS
jgi:uncharacterized protein (DUF1697 family)